ncbi:MAG: DUF1844 domain-containing protein [Candidatus Omnitrophica bacterium]|nr:DUF1844 domain-containing protein [Candidatus Omnitrophota bacterium]
METHEPSFGPAFQKKVDESWKNAVEKEKENSAHPGEDSKLPELNFPLFITSLGVQAFTALEKSDLKQAKSFIDLLDILAEKTKGNLSPEETGHLEALRYELKMKFVEKSQ